MNSESPKLFTTKKIVTAALFLAIGWLLPLLTGQIKTIGQMLLPMHLPVIISGYILGPFWGLLLGFITPVTRSLIFGMPALYPNAVGMAFELASYGFFCGFLFRLLGKSKKESNSTVILKYYGSLIVSMLIGRAVWGIVRVIMSGVTQTPITWKIFFATEFVKAWPGMIIQLIIIPPLVRSIKRM